MPLELDENTARYQVRAYRPGHLQVNDSVYEHSLIITPDQLIENWAPQTILEINKNSFAMLAELKPDVLLIGTGSELVFLPLETYGELINQGIGVEIMDTHAACRTFNALSAEFRNVVAALIIK